MDDKALKNHLQLEDAGMSPEERYVLRHRLNPVWRQPGLETPLGHAYAVILEALSEEGLDREPDPEGFVEYLRADMIRRDSLSSLQEVNLFSPLYHPQFTWPSVTYMAEQGLSEEGTAKVMQALIGSDLNDFEIRQYYKYEMNGE